MNARSTWLLFLIAVGLSAYSWLTRDSHHRISGLGAASSRGVIAIDSATVSAIEISRSNGIVRVERAESGWKLRSPVQALAQSTSIERFLKGLHEIEPRSFLSEKEVAANAGGLRALGLDPEYARVTLETPNGPTTLQLGGPTPVGSQFYYRRDNIAGVFVADAEFLKTLPTVANDWRERALLDFRSGGIDRVEIRGLTAFEVARDPGGGLWRFTQPLNARVDNVRFDQLISSIATTPVIEFISDQLLADPEIYGFNPPTHEIFFRRGTNEIVAHLQIGRVLTNKLDQIYVRNLTRTNLVTLPASMIQDLKLPLNDFRDRRLLPSLDSVDQIEFQTTGGAGVAQRLGTNWWVMKPGRFPASTGEIERQLTVLRGLEILDFPADVAPRPELFGLAKPIRRYVLSTTITNAGLATNRTIVDFNFGSSPRGDRIYARRSDETAVYTVPNLLVVLVETPNQLRDWRFELSQIVRIEIKHTNVVRELARSGSGGNWNEPARSNQSFSKETSEFIDELLFRLSTNESDRYAIRDEKPFLDSGGFRQRTHEITLHFREGSEFLRRLRVRFGGVIGNRNLALAYFDDDPIGIRVTIPEKLYGDIYLTLGGR